MNVKYRLHEVAKDLNVQNKDIVDLLEQYFGETKKHMTALTEEELNIVFEHFTQKNQVDRLDDYFASKEKPQPKEEKQEVKENVKKETKPAAKATNNNTKTEARPQNAGRTQQKNNRTDASRQGDAARQNNQNRPAAARQENRDNKPKYDAGRFEAAKKASVSGKPQAAKAEKPAPKQAAKPQPQNATKMDDVHYEKTVRHVDTSKVEINLDKYNEKYENIAPATKYQNSTKKQKLNQKSAQRNKQKYSTKKETEAEKLQRLALQRARKQQLTVQIPDEIVVSELASRLKVNVSEVIKKLMLLGAMASQNEVIDFDTASLVAEELGAKVEKEVVVTIEERLFVEAEDKEEDLQERNPIVVVMGHVDHGKTSILDRIRHADVTSTEAGGITQHIGAYRVKTQGRYITFLDTPGHEAFTSMRARGALATDIAILVVAADDGIMPQTVESINHAKAANVQVIVAINKMDKPTANPERVKEQLTEYGLVPEEWGGDVICVPVSAHTGEGIDQLLEMVLLTADMLELKANPNRLAKGTVIESRLDKGRGPIATLLVQNGTLKTGDVLIAGTTVGRVRAMTNDRGQLVDEAGPCVPVEVTGLSEVPTAGDEFAAVENERLARELVDKRKHEQKEEQFKQYQKVTLDNLFSQIEQGEMKELSLIVKADVNGSVEAIRQSMEKLTNEEVRVRVIHGGVGAVNRSDVMLAQTCGAIIIGFNVRPDNTAREMAETEGVEIRLYRIIYDAIDDVKQAIKGMLSPKTREVQLGRAEVRQVYRISNVGVVAGCYVLEGKVARNAQIRLVRDGIVLAEDQIDSLKRFKDDAKEVAQGYECGIGLQKFNDIHEGDIFESFIIEEYRED
ncbi:MAG: translation initiation factor IF-2 [Massiliimalia sp.]